MDYNEAIEKRLDELNLSKPLKSSLLEFVKYRMVDKNNPLSPYALNAVVSRLNDLASDEMEQIKIIEQTMICGWINFYPLRNINDKIELL